MAEIDFAQLIPTLAFYMFAAVTVISGLMVISSKNPVHSVFFLILAFFYSAALFVLLGAEYIAMSLVFVYVGAVAVLFLFVVMMLDVNFAELRQGFLKYLPVGGLTALIVFFELVVVYYLSFHNPMETASIRHEIPSQDIATNTHAIGNVMYTYYLLPFQMAGIVLLVAMIGAITLTLRHRPGVRRQSAAKQLSRTRSQSIEVVKVETGRGIGQ
ncbi:MAG: NADH-quinone oxidoreductase subunit J [Alphaproteobacteria bacterium]